MKELTPITTLVVKRKTWLRGEGSDLSYLLRNDGKMCCLGFAMLAAGCTNEEIMDMKTPADLFKHGSSVAALKQFHTAGDLCMGPVAQLMLTNDYEFIDEDIREAELIEDFAKLQPPVTLTFED